MQTVDLSDACARIQCISLQDWVTQGELIFKTWSILKLSFTEYLKVASIATPRARNCNNTLKEVDERPFSRQQATVHELLSKPPTPPTNGSGLVPASDVSAIVSSHSNGEPFDADNSPSQSAPKNHAHAVSQAVEKNPTPTITKSGCKVKLRRHQRAFENARLNVSRRRHELQKTERSALVKALSNRIAEFPPARASGDVSHRKKHGVFRIAAHLEAFMGAMFITEKYIEFQRQLDSEIKRQQAEKESKVRKGKPKNVYPEFAEHIGILNHKSIPSITKLGKPLLNIWKTFADYRGIFLVLDQYSTLSELSEEDVKRLKRLVIDNSSVAKVASNSSKLVETANNGYRKLADTLWEKKRMALSIASISEIMEGGDYETDDTGEDGSDCRETEPQLNEREPNQGKADNFTPGRFTSTTHFETATPRNLPQSHDMYLSPKSPVRGLQLSGEDRSNLTGTANQSGETCIATGEDRPTPHSISPANNVPAGGSSDNEVFRGDELNKYSIMLQGHNHAFMTDVFSQPFSGNHDPFMTDVFSQPFSGDREDFMTDVFSQHFSGDYDDS